MWYKHFKMPKKPSPTLRKYHSIQKHHYFSILFFSQILMNCTQMLSVFLSLLIDKLKKNGIKNALLSMGY